MRTPTLLIVDDNPADRALTALVLGQGVPEADVVEVEDGVAFAERLAEGGFQMVVAEKALSWGDGLEVLRLARRRYPGVECVLFSRQLPAVGPRPGEPPLAGYLQKNSEGYLELPRIVTRRLADTRALDRAQVLEQVLAGLPAGLLVVDESGQILQANPRAAEVLDHPLEGLDGRGVTDLLPGLASRQEWRALVEGRQDNALLRLESAGGSCPDLALRVQRNPGPGVGPHRITLLLDGAEGTFGPDATAVSDGGDSARDLEQLAYAVSHDLQEPLQLINRNARLLATRCGEQIDDDARRFLDHLINSGERLQGMLDGVLSYSRLGFGQGRKEAIDLNQVVEKVLDDLGPLLDEAGAEVVRDTLPWVEADANGIRQLYLNLIGNAVKFRGEQPLRITLGGEDDGPWWRLSVADNGIGIDNRFQERIFGMFQRLHSESEFPGTGIGLAICKKIVERSGGSIWVESEPESGSTFYFTLPRVVKSGHTPATIGE